MYVLVFCLFTNESDMFPSHPGKAFACMNPPCGVVRGSYRCPSYLFLAVSSGRSKTFHFFFFVSRGALRVGNWVYNGSVSRVSNFGIKWFGTKSVGVKVPLDWQWHTRLFLQMLEYS